MKFILGAFFLAVSLAGLILVVSGPDSSAYSASRDVFDLSKTSVAVFKQDGLRPVIAFLHKHFDVFWNSITGGILMVAGLVGGLFIIVVKKSD